MNSLPIVLGVRPAFGAENAVYAPPAKVVADKVLKRDDYTCRYCGFRSQKFQRVVPSPAAGTPPYATACTFCEQCLFLERAGITGAGILIWLPEISQAQVNHIARAAYVARLEGKEGVMTALATRVVDALTARRADAKKRLGSDDPMLLATLFTESLTMEEREQAIHKLDGIRLLPSEKHWMRGSTGDVNQFKAMAAYWRSSEGSYAKLPTATWQDLFKTALGAAGRA